ncbi:MAG: HD domain-containing phosphohydrolase [Fimbriimonas sp.]
MRTYLDARVLVIDDEPGNVRLVMGLLELGGYVNVTAETDSARAAQAFECYQPDLVILDLHMSPKDGFYVLHELEGLIPAGAYLPVLVLTGDISADTKERALAAGAMDFLAKPFNSTEILLRVRNLLHTRTLYLELRNERDGLEQRVQERTEEVLLSEREVVERLARVAEFRDDATGEHTKRVGEVVRQIGADMGLPAEQVELMARASLLHDIGKVCIPDAILLKPGRLTAAEYECVKDHAAIGGEILKGSRSKLLLMAESIARHHHEYWNGSGYAGLVGEAIPLEARLTAVADVFDALMSARPYKEAWPPNLVLEEIASLSGSHFDPAVVESFLRVAPSLMTLYEQTNPASCILRDFVTKGAPSRLSPFVSLDPIVHANPEPTALMAGKA